MRLKRVWGNPVKDEGCEYAVLWIDRQSHKPYGYCRTHHIAAAICEQCGEVFHTRRPLGAKTCSDRCRKKRSRSKV